MYKVIRLPHVYMFTFVHWSFVVYLRFSFDHYGAFKMKTFDEIKRLLLWILIEVKNVNLCAAINVLMCEHFLSRQSIVVPIKSILLIDHLSVCN